MTNDSASTEDRDIPGLRPTMPIGVGTKFYADGRVRPFPGNTIICHIPEGPSRDGLLRLHAQLSALELGSSISMLPTSSLHMTVFEGVCDQIRRPGHWPGDLAADAPLDVCDALFEQKLRTFDIAMPPPFRLRIDKLERLVAGIGLRLTPDGAGEEQRLRNLRDRLSELLRLRHADHETYVFHVSFAYLMRELKPQEADAVSTLVAEWQVDQPTIELDAPEFCRFESMFHFERQFFLGDHPGRSDASPT